MVRSRIAGVLLVCLCVAAGAQGKQAPLAEPASYVASIGEEIKEYAIQGHYAYLAQDHTFRVVDIADKKHPKSVGVLRMDDMIWSVAVYKNAAYCGMLYNGFTTIDISAPQHPRWKNYLHNFMRRPFTRIESGNLFIYSIPENHWETYSLADPLNPKDLDSGKLYLDDEKIYKNEREKKEVPRRGNTGPLLPGIFPEFKEVLSVAVSGQYAFLADGPGGLRVVDVSNPAEPRLATSLALPGDASDLVTAGHYVYVTTEGQKEQPATLQIIDISSPSQPKQIGSCPLPGEVRGIAIHDLTAYVLCDEKGLQIVDLTRPAQPAIRGEFPGNYWDILIDGKNRLPIRRRIHRIPCCIGSQQAIHTDGNRPL